MVIAMLFYILFLGNSDNLACSKRKLDKCDFNIILSVSKLILIMM